MTTPTDIRRLLARIRNSTEVAEARLDPATQSLQLRHAVMLKAKDFTVALAGGVSELTPTEAAAHANLGDVQGYDDSYRPGPVTQLSDLEDELRAALKSLERAHDALTKCGTPPLFTRQHQCHGINGVGCTDWKDPNRTDHLCIDCGRAVDSNRRRQRRHAAGAA